MFSNTFYNNTVTSAASFRSALNMETLDDLSRLYDELDMLIDAWSVKAGLACPSGCGSCCMRFTPDILLPEAEFLALHALESGTAAQMMAALEEHDGASDAQCPLYDPDTPLHCSVYAHRPLICRLFAFSGSRGSDGSIRFSRCRQMPQSHEFTAFAAACLPGRGSEICVNPDSGIPLMPDFGSRVEALSCGYPPRRMLLPQAVSQAVGTIRLRAQMQAAELLESGLPGPRDDDSPGMDTA